MTSMKSIKGFQRVEICEEVLKFEEDANSNEDDEEKQEIVLEEEDVGTSAERRSRSTKRSAMGEYIASDGETPLTQLAVPGPGPAAYAPISHLTKPSPPSYSITGKPKDMKQKADEVPGSDRYDIRSNMTWNKRTRTLKAKLETSPYSTNPHDHLTCSLGSAAYKVEYYDTGRHAPQHTFGSRYDNGISQGYATPGPNYAPHNDRGMEKSFGLRFNEISPETYPGPAAYNITHLDRGPKYSLGHRVEIPSGFNLPGPGAYEIKSTVNNGVGASICGRQPIRKKYTGPSPNIYTVPDTFRDAPKPSMTYRAFEKEVCETPGPANYDQICRDVWQTTPKFSCRQRCKPSFPAILNYPEYGSMRNEDVGPETYEADKGFDKNNSPAYSIGTRRPKLTNEFPGPAHYNITLPCRPDSFKAPEFSMGKAVQKGKGSIGPGPAAYKPQKKNAGACYSMSSRPKKKKK